MTTPRTPIATLVNDLLENGYQGAAQQVLDSIVGELQNGVIDKRLKELATEAERLAQNNEKLSPDNPVLLQLLRDVDTAMNRNVDAITSAAPDLAQAGVQSASEISNVLTFAGMSDNTRASILSQWNRPDPQAVASLVDFTNDNAFADMLKKYQTGVIDAIRKKVTAGFVQGWGARRSARAIRTVTMGLPASQAESLLRTLHLVAYRRGTAATQAANAHLLQPTAIRVAVLDVRTCLSCIALHGTPIKIGEPVPDHWQGRCTSIAVVKGFTRNITSGVDWFNSLDPQRQQEQLAFKQSPGAYAAYSQGAVSLNDFVAHTQDDLFGDMIYQASLSGILGADAQKYYKR